MLKIVGGWHTQLLAMRVLRLVGTCQESPCWIHTIDLQSGIDRDNRVWFASDRLKHFYAPRCIVRDTGIGKGKWH